MPDGRLRRVADGLRPFATRGQPSTRAEATERGVYTLLNAARSDMGSPLYGDVSAVVRSSAVREALLTMPQLELTPDELTAVLERSGVIVHPADSSTCLLYTSPSPRDRG